MKDLEEMKAIETKRLNAVSSPVVEETSAKDMVNPAPAGTDDTGEAVAKVGATASATPPVDKPEGSETSLPKKEDSVKSC